MRVLMKQESELKQTDEFSFIDLMISIGLFAFGLSLLLLSFFWWGFPVSIQLLFIIMSGLIVIFASIILSHVTSIRIVRIETETPSTMTLKAVRSKEIEDRRRVFSIAFFVCVGLGVVFYSYMALSGYFHVSTDNDKFGLGNFVNFNPSITALLVYPFTPAFLLWAAVIYYDRIRVQKVASEYCPYLAPFIVKDQFSTIELPVNCRYGDSHNLLVSLDLESTKAPDYLEVELQAAGRNINGDLKQRQPLAFSPATYLWNCNFGNTGTHVINLIYRLVDESNKIKKDLGRTSFEVRAIRLYRQYSVSIFAAITTIISLLYAMRYDLLVILNGLGLP